MDNQDQKRYYRNPIPVSAIKAPTLEEGVNGFEPEATNYPPNYPPESDYCQYPYPVWVLGTDVLTTKAALIPVMPSTTVVPGTKITESLWSPEQLLSLAKVLAKTLFEQGGSEACGIAAPQVGISWRMFVVSNKVLERNGLAFPMESGLSNCQIFINPKVTPSSKSLKKWQSQEMCLSIPGYSHKIAAPKKDAIDVMPIRYEEYTINYHTLTHDKRGKLQLITNKSYTNVYTNGKNDANDEVNWVLQHETDHLDGILFIEGLPGVNVVTNTYKDPALTEISKGQQGGVFNNALM